MPQSPLESAATRSESSDGRSSFREGLLEAEAALSAKSSATMPLSSSPSSGRRGRKGGGGGGVEMEAGGGEGEGAGRRGEGMDLNLSLSGFPELAFLAQVSLSLILQVMDVL